MRISLKVIIYLLTANVRLLSATGNKGGIVNIYYNTEVKKIKCNSPATPDSTKGCSCTGMNLYSCVMLIQNAEAKDVMECKFCISDDKTNKHLDVYIKNLDIVNPDCSGESEQPDIVLSVDNTEVKINCHIGETVKMRFNYPESHESNEKFWCWKKHSTCGDLKHESVDKFCIADDRTKKYVDVYIENLVKDDFGSYQCGFEKWKHVYPDIVLSVAEERTETTETYPTPRSGDPMNSGKIAAVTVCPALLLIIVLVLILCRHKLPRTQVCCAAGGSSEQETNAEHNTEGNQGVHHYEEIQMRNQQASSGDALPSVYATVNLPEDQIHYGGIKFQENSSIVSTDVNALPDANKNGSSACVNSSISSSQGDTHPPAAQQTLYSTVTIPKPGNA